jgi:hypothetical protein
MRDLKDFMDRDLHPVGSGKCWRISRGRMCGKALCRRHGMFGDAQTGTWRLTSVPGVKRSIDRLSCAGLALLFFCCANAFADGPVPTVAEAHQFLADTFQRYPVAYAVRYGNDYGDRYKGRVASYAGSECHSELRSTRESASGYAIDWSVVGSIQTSDPLGIYFSGQIFRDPRSDGDRLFSSFDLYYPDARVRQSAFNAFELLRQSCRRYSKFD